MTGNTTAAVCGSDGNGGCGFLWTAAGGKGMYAEQEYRCESGHDKSTKKSIVTDFAGLLCHNTTSILTPILPDNGIENNDMIELFEQYFSFSF